MARRVFLTALISLLILVSGCISKDNHAPAIKDITTSGKYFAKSDCSPTSVTITANIIDDTQVKSAALWYRVGQDQKFTSISMRFDNGNTYSATVIGLDIPGGEYGNLEFYIIAKDEAGNQSKSQIDTSVQLLPCVAS
jgi:hypothetical protein